MANNTIERYLSLCQDHLMCLKFILCQALIELIQNHIDNNLNDSESIRKAEKRINAYRDIQSQIAIDSKRVKNDKRISEWMSRKPEDIDNALRSVDAFLNIFNSNIDRRMPWRMACARCSQSVWEVARSFFGHYQRKEIDIETCCFGPESNTITRSIPFLRCFCKISHSWKTHFVDSCSGISEAKQQKVNTQSSWADYIKREPQPEQQ